MSKQDQQIKKDKRAAHEAEKKKNPNYAETHKKKKPFEHLFKEKKPEAPKTAPAPEEPEVDTRPAIQEAANKYNEQEKAAEAQDRAEAAKRGEEFTKKEVQGLSPGQKQALEDSSKTQYANQLMAGQRQIAASQGRHGIRGGTAYAQKADFAHNVIQGQQQAKRDIANIDYNAARANKAAQHALEMGEVQSGYARRGQAQERAEGDQAKIEAKKNEKKYGKMYGFLNKN
jgi:hypothetical protein